MPRKKRTTLRDRSNIKPAEIKDSEQIDRVDALYENWKASVESIKTMLINDFEKMKEQKLMEIDRLMMHLGPEVLNMTVKEFIESDKTESKVEKEVETHDDDKSKLSINQTKDDLLSIPISGIVDAIEQELKDLVPESSGGSGSETGMKKTRGRKKKPPRTARKKPNKKADEILLETPCSSTSAIPESWQDTPFLIPKRSRTGAKESVTEGTSSIVMRTPANSDEIRKLIPKSTWLSEKGSPIMWAPTNPILRRKIEEKMREIEEIQRKALKCGEE